MAEQQTRPPDLSPTDLPQPSVGPAGRYSYFYPVHHDNVMLPGQRYSNDYITAARFYDHTYKANPIPAEAHSAIALPNNASSSKPSIEDLLQGVWLPIQSQDPVASMLTDRLNVNTLGLCDVLEQIKERITLYRRHFDELEHAKLDVRNVRKRWTDPMDKIGNLPDPDLVSAIHELESQQRNERLSCWKDLSSLRQQLPEQWQQYLGAVRLYTLGSSNTLEGGRRD